MIDPQGKRAANNGSKFEHVVEDLICDLLKIKSYKWSEGKDSFITDNVLLKNVPYESIYGTKCRSEFVLKYDNRTIRIECKSQESAGSVDEKLPYLVENFTHKVPEEETIIIHHGSGFREGAIQWLRRTCEGTKCRVCDIAEFIFFLTNNLAKHADSNETS